MSSFDVSSPNATSALRNLPQDGHKNLNVVSLKMLEIAEKLESLNQQCHILEVENKGKYSVFFKEADSSIVIMEDYRIITIYKQDIYSYFVLVSFTSCSRRWTGFKHVCQRSRRLYKSIYTCRTTIQISCSIGCRNVQKLVCFQQ